MSRKLISLCILLGLCLAPAVQAAKIIWVSDGYDERPDGIADDQAAVDFLASLGYTVDYQRIGFGNGYWRTLDAAKIAALNAADLVICGRSHDSGQYATDAAEVAQWNGITAPLIHMSPYLPRNSRWAWYNNSTMSEDGGTPTLVAVDVHHPIFNGVNLNSKWEVDVFDQSVGSGTTSFMAVLEQGNGRLLAKAISGTRTIIAEWDAGKPFYAGSTYTPAGKRMMFCAGTREGAGFGRGEFNLNDEGKKLFANAIEYMIGNLVREPWVKAWQPNPADGATSVAPVTFTWTKGETAMRHNVYFGTDPAALALMLNFTPTQPMYIHTQPLEPGTKYYWRVDSVEKDNTVHVGDVWSFTTPSLSAFDPRPHDGAKWVDPNAAFLSWQLGQGAWSHDVYFGTDPAAVAAGTGGTAKGNYFGDTFDPGQLAPDTTYYWRVDTVLMDDSKVSGEVWSFTTLAPGGGIRALYFSNAALVGAPAYSQIDPQINFNWADLAPEGLPADAFSIRWTGELEVPFTETYTFYANTDDGVRLWVNNVQLLDLWTNRRAATEAKASIALVGGQRYPITMEMYNAEGTAVAELRWESTSIEKELIPQGAFSPPVRANGPFPAMGAADVPQSLSLAWSAGEKASRHQVYFGDDAEAVAAATTATAGIFRGTQVLADTTYDVGPLAFNKTYYWRVDEVNDTQADSPWKGSVWSFTTADFIVVDNFESYTNFSPNRVFQAWIDGLGFSADEFFPQANNGNGSRGIVGYDPTVRDIMEKTIVAGGQSMPFEYGNAASPYYSQADRTWTANQNWTLNGMTDLSLWFRGNPVGFAETATGITMSASGVDIWGTADEFRFAFKRLNGNGSIIAKVESVGNTNAWAKAGVMIRDTLDPSSKFAYMVATPGQGVSFGRRPIAAADCESSNEAGIVTPRWVKLTRTGNTITAQHSANGVTWVNVTDPEGDPTSVDLPMQANVYVGLCVTSHNANDVTTAVFSNITATGATGVWAVEEIGIDHPNNDPDQLYVTIQDSAGKAATVVYPNATTITTPTVWQVPLTQFTGVNMTAVRKMSIGVGDRNSPKVGGSGMVFIDDIRVIKPAAGQ